jgi:hypothetical protein
VCCERNLWQQKTGHTAGISAVPNLIIKVTYGDVITQYAELRTDALMAIPQDYMTK